MKPSNFIDPSAVLAPGVIVWHYAVILSGVRIGENSSIGSHAEIGRDSSIGANVRIGKGVFLPARSIVSSEVFIGPGTVFCDDKYPRVNNRHYRALPPIIETGASIGAGCVILPGIRIGAHSLVGAGSVVVEDVPPHSTVYGDAARLISQAQDLSLEPTPSEA